MERPLGIPDTVFTPRWRKGLDCHGRTPGRPQTALCGRSLHAMIPVRVDAALDYGMKLCPRCWPQQSYVA